MVQQAVDAVAACAGSVWQPPRGSADGCTNPVAMSYSHLITLKQIPPNKASFLQVLCPAKRSFPAVRVPNKHLLKVFATRLW
jgi:hypothetical protein